MSVIVKLDKRKRIKLKAKVVENKIIYTKEYRDIDIIRFIWCTGKK